MHVLRAAYFSEASKIIWRYQWFDEYMPKMPKEVGEALFLVTKEVIDQVTKIYSHMQLKYIRSEDKPIIGRNYVIEIAEKYYPGTLKILKNRFVNTITKEEEKGLNSKEMKVFNELKNILLITNEIYNDDKITNAVRIASNRNPKADHNALVKAAYNHLKRHRSDARYLSKSNIDIDTERELILSTKTNLE